MQINTCIQTSLCFANAISHDMVQLFKQEVVSVKRIPSRHSTVPYCVGVCVYERETVFSILFILWLGWVPAATWPFLWLQSEATCSARCSGFSSRLPCCGVQPVSSVLVAPGVWSTGSGLWPGLAALWQVRPPRPGMEPTSLALADGVLTTESSGKPQKQTPSLSNHRKACAAHLG